MCYKRQLPVLNANRNGIFYYIFIYQLLLYIYCQFFSWFKRNLCNLGISHWQPFLVFVGLLHSVKICCVFIKKAVWWPLTLERQEERVWIFAYRIYVLGPVRTYKVTWPNYSAKQDFWADAETSLFLQLRKRTQFPNILLWDLRLGVLNKSREEIW